MGPFDARERLLDATRDYAHWFRDRGQFGSHPSHDAYGDEPRPVHRRYASGARAGSLPRRRVRTDGTVSRDPRAVSMRGQRCAACHEAVNLRVTADGRLVACRVGTRERHLCARSPVPSATPHAKAPPPTPAHADNAGRHARSARRAAVDPSSASSAPRRHGPQPETRLVRWCVLGGKYARCAYCEVPVVVYWDCAAQDTVLLEIAERAKHRCGRAASRELAAARKAARAQVALELALLPARPRHREEARQQPPRPAARPRLRPGRAGAREFGVTPYDGPNSCPNCGGLLAGRGGDRTCFHCGA